MARAKTSRKKKATKTTTKAAKIASNAKVTRRVKSKSAKSNGVSAKSKNAKSNGRAKSNGKAKKTTAKRVVKASAKKSTAKKSTAKRASSKKSTSKGFSKKQYQEWYESMLLQRRFEERAGMLYGLQKIRGFCHLYIGQEAVSAGMMSALKKKDPVITAYRDHGLGLARGMSANECMAELFGKVGGSSKGKGGSMHYFSKEKYFMGGHGIVGAQIPMGAGIAFAEKYNNTKNVCVAIFGDGAARQGALHETFNLAMLWKLPVIFVCENNLYAMGTSVERTSNVTDIHQLGEAYDMPHFAVDGMEVEAVHSAIEEAAAAARDGFGPTFLEIKTYRYKGHSMSDPQKYRTKEELKQYKGEDPIVDVKATMLEKKFANDAWFKKIEQKIKGIVDASVEFAEASPFPDASELYEDVYIQRDYPYLKD